MNRTALLRNQFSPLALALAALLSLAALSLTSCHTVAGAGADVEHAGEGLQDIAHDAHDH